MLVELLLAIWNNKIEYDISDSNIGFRMSDSEYQIRNNGPGRVRDRGRTARCRLQRENF